MSQFSNKLINETSPYLLQHAHNPVYWYPWSDEALARARKENKPILVSIGYSACHWCHVMERESFENEETAIIMNENFVNIKIDREERPDLDHIYMDAVQAMTGSGGWPLNVFLTPEGKPFYGGTYFPPKPAFNRPSWQDVLIGVKEAFAQRRNEINAQAENLTEHLLKANSFGISSPGDQSVLAKEKTAQAFAAIMSSADKTWGGFSRAPKFPQTFVIQYLLHFYHVNKNEEALQQALLTIDKMIDGGIYDQVGGGFARYATDAEWLAPHFEKMLYDNALLLSVIADVYQLTKDERYRDVIDETIAFLKREMMHEQGGFYAALDADSEGVEGKYYVWNFEEVKKLLGDDAVIFCDFFDVRPEGNWEGKNILWRKKKAEVFCAEKNISNEKFNIIIHRGKKLLLEKRKSRIRPGTDDKILLGWNALMNTALSKCYAATGDESYRQLAKKNMEFLLSRFQKKGTEFYHSWKNDLAKQPAFLDDYAFLVKALVNLQEITGETSYLEKAKVVIEYVIQNFADDSTDFFYFTGQQQSDLIVRKKEVYDGAQPSGNAVMADNLYKLGLYFERTEWMEKSSRMINSLGNAIVRYPTSFGAWVSLLQEVVAGTNEIAILGSEAQAVLPQVLKQFIPYKIIMASTTESKVFPLLKDRQMANDLTIFLCRNYSCERPVNTVEELVALIRAKELKIS